MPITVPTTQRMDISCPTSFKILATKVRRFVKTVLFLASALSLCWLIDFLFLVQVI